MGHVAFSPVVISDGPDYYSPDYYRKFGFRNVPGLVLDGVPPEVFFALSFDGHVPQGTVTFHEAFRADGPQAVGGDA